MTRDELRRQWTLRRDEWRKLGVQVDGGKLAEEVLEGLAQLEAPASEAVSLAEAAAITGMSSDHIGRLIRRHQLPNIGRKHAPRIPRAALEHLGKRFAAAPKDGPVTAIPIAGQGPAPYNPAADARSLLRRRAPGGSNGA